MGEAKRHGKQRHISTLSKEGCFATSYTNSAPTATEREGGYYVRGRVVIIYVSGRGVIASCTHLRTKVSSENIDVQSTTTRSRDLFKLDGN